jgi:hypothetical protein
MSRLHRKNQAFLRVDPLGGHTPKYPRTPLPPPAG